MKKMNAEEMRTVVGGGKYECGCCHKTFRNWFSYTIHTFLKFKKDGTLC